MSKIETREGWIRTFDGKMRHFPKLTRTAAIDMMCTECVQQEYEVEYCTDDLCPLYPWRGWTARTRTGTHERPE